MFHEALLLSYHADAVINKEYFRFQPRKLVSNHGIDFFFKGQNVPYVLHKKT